MLEDTQASVLVTQQRLVASLPAHHAQVVCIDADGAAIAQEPDENFAARYGSHTVGVCDLYLGLDRSAQRRANPHGAVVNFLESMCQRPGLNASDVLLAVTTLSFDIAALEVFLPSSSGLRWCS